MIAHVPPKRFMRPPVVRVPPTKNPALRDLLPALTPSQGSGDGATVNSRGLRLSYVRPEVQRTRRRRSNLTIAAPYRDAYTVARNALLEYAEEIGAEVDFNLVPVPAENVDLENL